MSFGIFQDYYSSPKSGIPGDAGSFGTIGTSQMGVMYLMMPLAMLLLRKYPFLRRWCGPLGLLVTMVSLVASAFVRTVGGLLATQGIIYAVGCGLLFSPISMYVDDWFSERKGMAYGVMWSGKAAVGLAMPFVFQSLLDKYGLRTTILSWTVASAVLTLPLLFFLKPRVPLPRSSQARPLSFAFLRNVSFWTMQIGIAVQALGYIMPSTYMASYASKIGLQSESGPVLVGLFSFASIPGAVTFGIMGDKMSATKVISISSIGSAVAVFLLWGLSRHFANMIVFVLAYGFFAGGFSSTWSSMVREIMRDDRRSDSAVIFGMLLGGRGVGFVLGGPISGALSSAGSLVAQDSLGYATTYGPIILCTGITAVLGAWGPFCKGVNMASSRVGAGCVRPTRY